MSTVKQLSWTPIRRGNVYCAPACGASCTVGQYNKALKAANTLARRMGKGWKPVVNENMGWFASVISPTGHWKIHISSFGLSGRVLYTAFLGAANQGGGKWAETAYTPEAAIKQVQKVARAYLRQFESWPIDIQLAKRRR